MSMRSAFIVAILLTGLALFNLRPHSPPVGAEGSDAVALQSRTQLPFSRLAGWQDTDPLPALAALNRSCAVKRPPEGLLADPLPPAALTTYRALCQWAQNQTTAPWRPAPLRFTLEFLLAPTLVQVPGEEGRLTGYFEPVYPARLAAAPPFTAPALGLPSDLKVLDLGAFAPDLAGRSIRGRVERGTFVPYPDRAEIETTLPPDATIHAYMHPTDLFFMQIQGSGRIQFPSGESLRLGYAGQNGRPYYAIGRQLIERGEIPRERMSMQAIRTWLNAAPADAAIALRQLNRSYIFFRPLTDLDDGAGPIGAQGVQLTAAHSIAVDDEIYGYGLPFWLEAETADAPLHRLAVAQDTGGAIRGAQRADLYTGSGDAAAEEAGPLNAPLRLIALLPVPLPAPLPSVPALASEIPSEEAGHAQIP
ncbi:membrane-bound lytic murein transglycosylase A [Parvularcula bermudensis HTCC2503]|uniref:peptidoglycan lytic exotransglycosylase n=1 Tax=Parvularcula bermudensis (strain ATCC BAA-594 / HTCC2503 / KCTC 12087) TaxID=314260 RepID=E0TF65_PARBH|nr:MltA domain-containing protein [Parvularcula bermudensis]ADM08983.1 membrane-bound lytic murein transglycosylase A [Parvularcula bermudensis HTCC2503]